eukprot:CAMPEP_0176139046 /NCGR_PEP_ID=MMETSP0120_2-20121206/70640_1 /TAXON_ID=160619 /ORGANISM="Kryptoperidinium foliaceum, Strain CCMP 1326" /LENGTH=410 /DNA_ID=CAMNT_0017475013 /DNA_START=17 /DNA_END=1249 /DNA_ORIENTATION=+
MTMAMGRPARSPSSPLLETTSMDGSEDSMSASIMRSGMGRTLRPKTEPLWRSHDAKAQKNGQRGTIYWVGKAIMGEDGSATGQRKKGASYHGEWGDNKKAGYGVQVYPSGEKYEGQWSNGLRNGEGTFWAPVGKAKKLRKVYVGSWENDKRHGRGTCFFKNGEFFQGLWDQGKMHGQGTLRYANGDMYVGDWHQGMRSGKGTLNKANGDCYEGYWLNDKREGSGSFFYASSGKVFVGEWANDLPKAGVYTQASPNPDQAGGVIRTRELPCLRLALPTEVLEGALSAVRNARKGFRARTMPLQRLFSDDEVDALAGAFEQVTREDGSIGLHEVQALCSQLGSEMNIDRVTALLKGAGFLADEADEHDVSIGFEDFLRLIAVLLEEEAKLDHATTEDDDAGSDYLDSYMEDQ